MPSREGAFKRDVRQCRANWWLITERIRVNPAIIFSVLMPFIFTTAMFIIASSIYNPDDLQLHATHEYFVTTNTPDVETNYFVSEDSTFKNGFELKNCTLLERFEIGLVKQDSKGSIEGFAVLESIFDELADAYKSTWEEEGESFTLKKKIFDTSGDLEDYVEAFGYRKEALCFALGWDEYDPSTDTFAVDLRWNFGTILENRKPQTDYEESTQNQEYLPQYGETGFFQTMTTITSKILSEVYGKQDFQIQMMYMPMNSGVFHNDEYSEVFAILVPVLIYSFIKIPGQLIKAVGGTNADEIRALLQRIGVRKSSEMLLEQSIRSVLMVILLPLVAWMTQQEFLQTTSFSFILVNMILFSLNQTFESIGVRFAFDSHTKAEIAELSLEFGGIFITVLSYYFVTIPPLFVYITSFVSPIPAITWCLRLGIIAYNRNINVALFQDNPIVNGVDLTVVLQLAFAQCITKILVTLYTFPFKISNDEQGSNGLFYLFTAAWWRSCCCKNDNQEDSNKYPQSDQASNDDQNSIASSFLINEYSTDIQDSQVSHLDEVFSLLHKDEQDMIEQGKYERPSHVKAGCQTLKLDRVTVGHGDHHVMNELSQTIFEGEVFALIGQNGCGKSAVLQTIACLSHDPEGVISAFGIKCLFKALRYQKRNFLTLSSQDDILIAELSPEDHIIYYCKLLGISDICNVVQRVLTEFDLIHIAHIHVQRLARAQRKKLQLALSLLGDCKIVLLDEPTNGMDPQTKRTMWEIIKRNKKGRCIMVATQDMSEARELADRIGLLSHGKIELCGSPDFFAHKFNHAVQLKFSLCKQKGPQENQKFEMLVKAAVMPDYVGKLDFKYNAFGQLVVTLPYEIEKVGTCIDMQQVQTAQGKLYESLTVQKCQLADTFQEMIESVQHHGHGHDKHAGNEDQQDFAGIDSLERAFNARVSVIGGDRLCKVGWKKSTLAFIRTDFIWSNIWWPLTKIVLVTTLILLQETLFISTFFWVNQPIINYSDIEATFEENHPPVLFFANSLTPSGEETSWLTDKYTNFVNKESSVVQLGEMTWTPEEGADVNTILSEAAEQFQHLQEEAEEGQIEVSMQRRMLSEHEEGMETFAAYYIYEADQGSNTYSIGVYGNQMAAASCNSFGATMLQTLAQQIANKDELTIEFRNHMLPINHVLFPNSKPTVSEVYGVAILASLVYILQVQAEWHGKPISSGFYDAFILKGGYMTSYNLSKYLKMVITNIELLLMLIVITLSKKMLIPGIGLILALWILTSPLMILAMSSQFTLKYEMSYKKTNEWISNVTGYLSVIVVTGAGNIALSQGKNTNDSFEQSMVEHSKIYPPLLIVSAIERGFLATLTKLIDNQDADSINNNAMSQDFVGDSYYYLLLELILWGSLFVLAYKKNLKDTCRCCLRPREPRRIEPNENCIFYTAQDVKKDREQVKELIDHRAGEKIVLVDNLQCMKIIPKTQIDRKSKYTNDQVFKMSRSYFGYYTVKGISLQIDYTERLAILGASVSGASYVISAILGFIQPANGQIYVDNIRGQEIYKSYDKLHGIIGYQPMKSGIDEQLTVKQHLDLFAKLASIPAQDHEYEVEAIMDACQLTDIKDHKTISLSQGQIRRLTLSMALIGRPKLVVLDNPLDNIDAGSKNKLIETILQYTQNRSLLVATSDVHTAQLLGDRIAIMSSGKILATGTAGEIIQNHGKGYTIEVQADMKYIEKQGLQAQAQYEMSDSRSASNASTVDSETAEVVCFIETEEEARELLSHIQDILEDQESMPSCELTDEFQPEGLLKDFHKNFIENAPYPATKFCREVFVLNLAFSIFERINVSFQNDNIKIASIDSGLIRLSMCPSPNFCLIGFSQEVDSLMQEFGIDVHSVYAKNLDTVFSGLVTQDRCGGESFNTSSLESSGKFMKTSDRRQTRLSKRESRRGKSIRAESNSKFIN